MNTKLVRSRRPPLVGLALAVALLVAACGSSSSSGSTHTSTTASVNSRTKLEACLKQHGVSFPKRAGAGQGQFGGAPPGGAPGSGTNPAGPGTTPSGGAPGFSGFGNSKFRTALKDCGAKFGGFAGRGNFRGGNFRSHFSASTLAAFSTCVKKHGYTLPKANTSGKGPIFPRSVETNAKFRKASVKCASLLRPSFGSGSSTTSSS